MPYRVDDTIAALATAPGGAVRGVVRLSGPDTIACLLACFQPHQPLDLRAIARATVVPGSLTLNEHSPLLPCDLFLWPTTRSYTRQIAAELHTIGAPPLLDATLEVLCRHGARLAEPGEFTMRAFLAGRLDLTQAEAVLGVVDAEDSRSLDIALTQLAGGLAGPLGQLRSDLLDLLADLEAGLDFVEEDIALIGSRDADQRLETAQQTVKHVLHQIASRGTATREPRVVLRGWPNVGKSSLINSLCEGQVALVSKVAGTTRDYVSRHFRWAGLNGVLVDTAGVEEPSQLDTIGAESQRLAEGQLRQADLELLCLDATRPLNPWEQAASQSVPAASRLVVWTKIDAGSVPEGSPADQLQTSSRTGEGIERLREQICDRLVATGAPATLVVASTAQRCQTSLLAAVQHIDSARELLAQDLGHELVALELRESLDQVGQVVGAVYTDDILDRVFHRFCIGK